MEPKATLPQISLGKVTLSVDEERREVVLESMKASGLQARIPMAVLEAWVLRKLREELMA